jgi:hypothetical protein
MADPTTTMSVGALVLRAKAQADVLGRYHGANLIFNFEGAPIVPIPLELEQEVTNLFTEIYHRLMTVDP